MDSIQITTGEKRIPITRDGQNVGEIVFNPSDVAFAERFYKIVADFETKLKEYESEHNALPKDKDGDPVDSEHALALLREACTFTREKIDYVFGEGTSQIVFGDTLKLEIFPQFFDGITPLFESVRSEKIAKYLPPTNGKVKKPRIKKPRKRK